MPEYVLYVLSTVPPDSTWNLAPTAGFKIHDQTCTNTTLQSQPSLALPLDFFHVTSQLYSMTTINSTLTNFDAETAYLPYETARDYQNFRYAIVGSAAVSI